MKRYWFYRIRTLVNLNIQSSHSFVDLYFTKFLWTCIDAYIDLTVNDAGKSTLWQEFFDLIKELFLHSSFIDVVLI